MSLSASEKVAVIRMVEDSALSIRKTLKELGISAIRQAGRMPFAAIHVPQEVLEKLPESVKE